MEGAIMIMEKHEVVKWQEGINLENLNRKNIFDAIQAIDQSVFHENGLATEQSDIDRYEAYKDSYIFALCEGKIVGYLCYFPITEKFYKSVVKGEKVYDGDIVSTDICGLNDNANYIFLLSVAILPEYQKQGISKQFSKLITEEFSRIKIRDIVSYAFTAGGEHFLNNLGLRKYKDMEDEIKLMRLFQNDNFDLILAIPCDAQKGNKKKSKGPTAETSPMKFSDSPVKCGNTEFNIKNVIYDNESNLLKNANIFCEQIAQHSEYELIFNRENSNIYTERTPLLFGQVIIYEDKKNIKYIPKCCYNFFCVLGELTIGDSPSLKNNSKFNIIYFVVPDINYQDLTLLMDQSHELWCNIDGQCYEPTENRPIILNDYLADIGYKHIGKIYRIIFSDYNQFEMLKKNADKDNKLFNILAGEESKGEEAYCHQIQLSENTNEYLVSYKGSVKEDIELIKKEKFYDTYNMYGSYEAYASIYSYYYVIKEEKKDIFYDRIATHDTDSENFSSEANILFVLETEIYKITASLVLSKRVNEQIKNEPNMTEIQKMFKNFINTRPLFEKLNYRYLGAQKEADFIYKQFRIGDILTDYDRKRELLKNYTEVTHSIITNRNSKIMQFIGILFTFISGFSILSYISNMIFDNETTLTWKIDFIIPSIVFVIIVGIFIPKKSLKNLVKEARKNIQQKMAK
jgi:GNAT superfamily N-acetyltransferase